MFVIGWIASKEVQIYKKVMRSLVSEHDEKQSKSVDRREHLCQMVKQWHRLSAHETQAKMLRCRLGRTTGTNDP